MRVILAAAALVALAISPVRAQTEVAMISFGGATNLPVWIALDLAAARGVKARNL